MSIQLKKIRKIMRVFALSIFGFLAILLVSISVLCLVLRFDFAENYLRDVATDYINDTLSPYQMNIEIDKIELALPFSFYVHGLKLDDLTGTFTEIEKISFRNDFFSLLRYEIVVPEIGFINAQITKVPHLVFPVSVEKNKTVFSFPQVDQILTELAKILFHADMPTIRLSKIHVENLLVGSSVINQIKTLDTKSSSLNLMRNNFINDNTAKYFKELRIDFITDASLDKSLFRIASLLKIGVDTGVPMTLNASLDIFKFKKIRSRIQYNDADGIVIALAKEILSLPHSDKAYASFNMEGSGDFDDFSMQYNANIFDDMYVSKVSTVEGELGIIPLSATMNMHFFLKNLATINHGDIKFNAGIHLLDEVRQSEESKKTKSNNLDEKNLKVEATQGATQETTQEATQGAIQKGTKKEAGVINLQVKYDLLATSMDFSSDLIQGLLGNKQKSQGQLNVVVSTDQYPYAKSDNIYFESKNIKANTRLFLSREIDMHAQASILDLSALGSQTQNISGRAEGEISIAGDISKLLLNARFEVPILRVQVAGEENRIVQEDKESNIIDENDMSEKSESTESENIVEDRIIELKSFVFVLKSDENASHEEQKETINKKSKNTEDSNIEDSKAKVQKDNSLAVVDEKEKSIEQNKQNKQNTGDEYTVQIKDFFQLFLQNERKSVPFLLNAQAQYNGNPVHFSSQLILGAGLVGEESVESRDFEINNLLFKGLGAELQGDLLSSWDASEDYLADMSSLPLLRGNLMGRLEKGETLALVLNQPISIDDASFKWTFSVDKAKASKAKDLKYKDSSSKDLKSKDLKSKDLKSKDSSSKDLKSTLSSKKNSGRQNMHWQFSATNFIYDVYVFQNNSMDFMVQDLWRNPYIKGFAEIKEFEFNENKLQNWQLKLDGSLLDLNVETSLNGDATFLFKGLVGIDRKRQDLFLDMYTLDFTHAQSKTDIRLKQKGQLRWSDKEFIANKIHFQIAPKGEFQLNGVLRPKHVALTGWWKDIDLKNLPIGYKGNLFGRFDFAGTSMNPTGTLEMRFEDLSAPGYPPLSVDVKGVIVAGKPIHKLALTLSLVDKKLSGIKDAEITVNVPMESSPWLRIARTSPIEGIVKYDGALGGLWQYVPLEGRKLIGHLFVDGKVSGTVLKPFVTLHAQVKDAYYQDIILGISLSDIDAQFDLNPYGHGKLLFSTLDNHSGTMSIQGDVVLPWLSHGTYKAPIKITGETPSRSELNRIKMWEKAIAIVDLSSKIQNFKPLQRSDVQLTLTGDFKVTGMITDPSLVGYLRVDEGKVQLENIRGSSIPELNIVEDANDKFQRQRRTIGSLDFTLDIPKKFYVLGPGIESEWKGNLKITGKVNQPKVLGSISAIGGKMHLLNKDFSLVKGEVGFDGSTPIAPMIDVQLGYNEQGIDATIGLSGTVDSPKLELTSVPYLPEDEILSRILFSSSVSELSAYEKIRLATMLTRLAGFSFQFGVADFGRKLFGLDVIRIGSGTAQTTNAGNSDEDDENISVELGKYLRDNIYIGVEQGITNQETVGITNFEINNNFSVGAQGGTEDAEINLEWRFDY